MDPTKEADIYSYAIIMYEISTRDDPYSLEMIESKLQPQGKYYRGTLEGS